MGIVIEYAGREGQAAVGHSETVPLELRAVRQAAGPVPTPDQIFDMTFAKQNAAEDGFNLWTINDVAFSEERMQPDVSRGTRQALPAAHAQRE